MNLYCRLSDRTMGSSQSSTGAVLSGHQLTRHDEDNIAVTSGSSSANPGHLRETFIPCSEDPDVVIVVGGKEFREYRQALRCWSGYFDVALRSGMKETKSLRFEFPSRKPEEWAWIVSLMAPMSPERITARTLPTALDWFDELCSTRGMEACDLFVFRELVKGNGGTASRLITAKELQTAVKYVGVCLQYNLETSKEKCFWVIQQALTNNPRLFAQDKEILKQVVALVKDNEECRQELWGTLKQYMPSSIAEEQRDLLLPNSLLHELIHLELKFRYAHPDD